MIQDTRGFRGSQFVAAVTASIILLAGIASANERSGRLADDHLAVNADVRAKSSSSSMTDKAPSVPVIFEENQGQVSSDVRFLARARGYHAFFTSSEVVLSLASGGGSDLQRSKPGRTGAAAQPAMPTTPQASTAARRDSLRMQLVGARRDVEPAGVQELSGRVNYLRGNDRSKWRRDVPTFGEVRYSGVYPGIDASFRGTGDQLEYDFFVGPGADPAQISIHFEGQQSARIAENGDLILSLKSGDVRQERLTAYQPGAASKSVVSSTFEVDAGGNVTFHLGEFDRTAPLVIDPVIVFSDYLGSTLGSDRPRAVAVDAAGAIYVAGTTDSSDFPTTTGSFQVSPSGQDDAFVLKLGPDGQTVVYCTLLGGGSGDFCCALAVDSAGAAYVTGYTNTNTSDFPTTPGAFDTTSNSPSDAFVSKLSPSGGSLVYSTFLGGNISDFGYAIAVDANGWAYVAGRTDEFNGPSGFPVTTGAFDTTHNGSADAFVAKFNPTGSALGYCTYIGGSDFDEADAVAVDSSGNCYIAGHAKSSGYPTTAGAFDTSYNGINAEGDVVVTKVNAAGSGLVYSTFLGGTGYEWGRGIAVNGSGEAYVTGETLSVDFPTTAGAFQTSNHGGSDAFVVKFSSNGSSLAYSTLLGGSADERAYGIALDGAGAAFVTGSTASGDYPVTAGAFDTSLYPGALNGFVSKVAAGGATLGYSTFLGGRGNDSGYAIAVDSSDQAVVCGTAGSPDFPTIGGSMQSVRDGSDVFIARFTAAGGTLVSSRVLGGIHGLSENLSDYIGAVAVDSEGCVYLVGGTAYAGFPTTPGSYDTSENGNVDMFVTKLNPAGDGIVFSTFIGASGDDYSTDLALDANNAIHVCGATSSPSFPTTTGAFDRTYSGTRNSVVLKLSADGASLVYSTLLSGTNDDGAAVSVKLRPSGNACVVGSTKSATFPTTAGAFSTLYSGMGDCYVAEVSSNGASLVFSTFLGSGSIDEAADLEIDGSGALYVTGDAGNGFPVTPGAYDTTFNGATFDVFVAKVSSDGSTLAYSTFLGGASTDLARGVAVDGQGCAFVTGTTSSPVFPTTPGAYQTVRSSSTAGVLTKLNSTGTGLVYSTLLDANGIDDCYAVAVNESGSAVVSGLTRSTNFPVTPGAIERTSLGGEDATLCQFSADGSALLYSTLLGGNGDDEPYDVVLDDASNVYVAGVTLSTNFPASGFGILAGYSGFVLKIVALNGTDTPGLYDPSAGAFYLRNNNSPGPADMLFTYGAGGSGLVSLVGDWNGDGTDTIGVYNPATGAFFLRNANGPGPADIVFTYGAGGAGLVPVVGDFNGDGLDTIGVYDPSSGAFFLRNSNSPGNADIVFPFGVGGVGIRPLVGDWNGDAVDTVGLYDTSTGAFFLNNHNTGGVADIVFTYGPAGATPVVGDWNGDGVDTVGISVTGTGAWFLRNSNTAGFADLVFSYGLGGFVPCSGNWDGL